MKIIKIPGYQDLAVSNCIVSDYTCVQAYICILVCVTGMGHASSLKGQSDVIVIQCESHIKGRTSHNLCKLAFASQGTNITAHRHTGYG